MNTYDEVFDYYMEAIEFKLECALEKRNSSLSDIENGIQFLHGKEHKRVDTCFERNSSGFLINMAEYTGYIRGLQLALEALNALKKHKSEMEKEGTE